MWVGRLYRLDLNWTLIRIDHSLWATKPTNVLEHKVAHNKKSQWVTFNDYCRQYNVRFLRAIDNELLWNTVYISSKYSTPKEMWSRKSAPSLQNVDSYPTCSFILSKHFSTNDSCSDHSRNSLSMRTVPCSSSSWLISRARLIAYFRAELPYFLRRSALTERMRCSCRLVKAKSTFLSRYQLGHRHRRSSSPLSVCQCEWKTWFLETALGLLLSTCCIVALLLLL